MKLSEKVCTVCQKEFLGKRGSRQCSDNCREISYRTRLAKISEKKRNNNKSMLKVCKICGLEFETKHNTKKTCSKECSILYKKAQDLEHYKNNIEYYYSQNAKRRYGIKYQTPKWDKELTDLVYMEAHRLRKQRNQETGFDWHVDHIIPLRGKAVSGLHVWNNFAVIPKVDNLRKGNKNSVYERWQA